MASGGRFTSSYTQLLSAIHEVGGTPCEDYPDLFYPEDVANPDVRKIAIKMAKQLCGNCPIKIKCFEYALETNQRHGIWGGTMPAERI